MKVLMTIFIISYSSLLFAQDLALSKKKIFVDLENVKKLGASELSYIRKSSFDTIFLTQEFDLLLSRRDASSKVYTLSSQIDEDINKLYKVNFSLSFAGKIINSITEANIEKNKIQYRSRILLMKLFFGENYDESADLLLKKGIIPLKIKKKDQLSEQFESENISIDQIMGEPSSNRIDEGLDQDESAKLVKPKMSKVKRRFIQPFEAPDLVLTKNKVSKKFKPKRKLKWFTNSTYSLGQEVESVNSKSIVDIQTKSTKVVFDYNSSIQLEDWANSIRLGLSVAKPVNEVKFRGETLNFGPRLSLRSNYNVRLTERLLSVAILSEYESVQFGAVGRAGGGLNPYSNTSVFFGGGVELNSLFFSREITFSASIKKSLISKTDLDSIGSGFPTDAVKQSAAIGAQLYGGFGLRVEYQSSRYSSLSVKEYATSHELMAVMLTYK